MNNNTNPILYAVIGGMAALILAIGGYVAYEKISRQNDIETAQKMYELRHMSNDELRKRKGDTSAQMELARRNQEVIDTLNIQNRD